MERLLTVYYTSDLHGHLFQTDYISRQEKSMGLFSCAEEFTDKENILVIDGGDILQGSAFAYYCQIHKDNSVIAEGMNAYGYDFVAIGNHDFNYGTEYLKEYLGKLNAVCVCQNIREKRSGLYPFGWRKCRLKNGLRIGIAGIVTDFVNLWEKEENLGEYVIEPPFIAAQKALSEMRGEVDIKICVYHGGFEADLDTGKLLENSGENIGYRICRELDYDLLLTGHQHMAVAGENLFGTYTVQPPCNGRAYCELRLFQGYGLRVESELHTPRLKELSYPKAAGAAEKTVQLWLDAPLCRLKEELLPEDKLSMALHGSPIADMINRIQLEISKADISCTSLANEICGFHKELTIRDILTTYPFSNTLVVLEVTGRVVKDALERSAEYFVIQDGDIAISEKFLHPKEEHYNYDYFYGITFERDLFAEEGERIRSIKFHGKDIGKEDSFLLCLNSYRASGAGGYDMYLGCRVVQTGTKEIAEELLEYFSRM